MNQRKFSKQRVAAFHILVALASSIILASASAAATVSPQRDHLTPPEVELVREAQELDRRTAVFIKAAERRLLSLTDPHAAQSKQVQKDLEKWGELPKGTRAELLSDISKILDEAITNIDDSSARAPESKLLPKALRQLAEAATNFLAQLAPMRASTRAAREREALEHAIENMQEIVAAANKLPPPPAKK